MEVLGIKFAPLNIPFVRRIQTLAAGGWFLTFGFGSLISIGLAAYLILYSNYWFSMLLYLTWIWTIDRDTCERGGRRLNWVRNLSWWKYMRDYFPLSLQKVPNFDLDPNKNYLFCSFPHGILSTSAFFAFATNASDFDELCPNHTSYPITLKSNFFIPFFREWIYSLGMCSASADSIKWILRNPDGGNVVVIVVGGATEAFYSKPGQYRLALKNRKGFIRIALENGTSLVPVFSFGENDLFDQVDNPEGSLLRKCQEWVKKLTRISPVIPIGRGFLQYSFGLVPERKPVTTLIGPPLDVEKIKNPTSEDISDLHEKFINHLTIFFEEHKHKYMNNSDNIHLVIS